jgi:DNA invertase Pin-like site-specific DNA recombinase
MDQDTENQVTELRRYCEARGWTIAREYIDQGVSGAKERRPALDDLSRDAKRRRFDVLVVWRLDRLGRNLKHLITLLDDVQALGVAFVSLSEGIDATTPAGRLQLHVLGAIAEFERARIAERVRLGMARARTQGTHLGRPKVRVGMWPSRRLPVCRCGMRRCGSACRSPTSGKALGSPRQSLRSACGPVRCRGRVR